MFETIPKQDAPENAGFAFLMPDESMHPCIEKGERCFVSKEDGLSDGELGLFVLDGELVCRQYCEDCLGNIYLFTVNRAMKEKDAVVLRSSERLRFIGRIILEKYPPLPL